MSNQTWTPSPPYADPPADLMPPESRALLRRLDAWAERVIANNPQVAQAIRRGQAGDTPHAAARAQGREG